MFKVIRPAQKPTAVFNVKGHFSLTPRQITRIEAGLRQLGVTSDTVITLESRFARRHMTFNHLSQQNEARKRYWWHVEIEKGGKDLDVDFIAKGIASITGRTVVTTRLHQTPTIKAKPSEVFHPAVGLEPKPKLRAPDVITLIPLSQNVSRPLAPQVIPAQTLRK